MTFIYLKDTRIKTASWSPLNTQMAKRVTFGSAISLTVTNLEGSSKKLPLFI